MRTGFVVGIKLDVFERRAVYRNSMEKRRPDLKRPTRITSVRDLGQSFKSVREGVGWTHLEAAAWLGVGTRFLFDLERGKSSVQMGKALDVAAKMGIRLFGQGPASPNPVSDSEPTALPKIQVQVPPDHPAPRTWMVLRYAAISMAKNSGIEVAPFTLTRAPNRDPVVTLDPGKVFAGEKVGTLSEWCRANGIQIGTGLALKEEGGGPSFARILELTREYGRHPLPATQQLVRWFIFSVMIADSDVDIDCVRVAWSESNPDAFDLLPFTRTMCFASGITERPFQGLKVGTAIADGFLRADQWTKFAKDVVNIHPKVIFQMMRVMSVRVPGLLDAALLEINGQPPSSRTVLDAIKEVRNRAARMNDLMLTAKRQVSGLSTKIQPKLDPLATRLTIEAPKRFPTVLIDDRE